MTNDISRRDWEALSAYLDDQLKPRARARLEARMQTDPRLRAALDELGQTRTLLRSLPTRRPPRNFTLTPEMVGVRPFALRLLPALRMASALATLVLALILAGDVFGAFDRLFYTAAPDRRLEAPLVAQEAEPALVETAVVTQETEGQIFEAPPLDAEHEVERLEEGIVVTESAGPGEIEKSAGGMVGEGTGTPLAEMQPPEAIAPAESASALPEPTLTPTPTEQPTPVPTPQATVSPSMAEIESPSVSRSLVHTLEVILAAIAVITGTLAFVLRRRSI